MANEMPWRLEFYDVSDGDELGSATFDGRRLTTDGDLVAEIVEGHSPAEVLELYNGWSNGYVSARLVGDKRTMPQDGTRIPTTAEHKKAMTNFFETNRYVDPTTGEEYDPVEVPADPTPDPEGNDAPGATTGL